jgi:hypothetical protein
LERGNRGQGVEGVRWEAEKGTGVEVFENDTTFETFYYL